MAPMGAQRGRLPRAGSRAGPRVVGAAVVVTVLGTGREVLAQNARFVPIGGRTATMGGAGTAAGNDSAMPYLNPAGLAGIPQDIFALSATVYGHTRRSFDGVFYPNGTEPGLGPVVVEKEEFSTSGVFELPSSVMYLENLSPADAVVAHRVAIALLIPEATRFDLIGAFEASYPEMAGFASESLSITTRSTTYYLGPS